MPRSVDHQGYFDNKDFNKKNLYLFFTAFDENCTFQFVDYLTNKK